MKLAVHHLIAQVDHATTIPTFRGHLIRHAQSTVSLAETCFAFLVAKMAAQPSTQDAQIANRKCRMFEWSPMGHDIALLTHKDTCSLLLWSYEC